MSSIIKMRFGCHAPPKAAKSDYVLLKAVASSINLKSKRGYTSTIYTYILLDLEQSTANILALMRITEASPSCFSIRHTCAAMLSLLQQGLPPAQENVPPTLASLRRQASNADLDMLTM